MIIYNVTVNVDYDIHDEWLDWMKEVHIPEVLNTGLFFEAKMSRILAEEEGGKSYSIQYTCDSMESYEKYRDQFAPHLQQKHTEKYAGKFVAFRTLLRIEKNFKS